MSEIRLPSRIDVDERKRMATENGLRSGEIVYFYDSYGSQVTSCWEVGLIGLRDQIDALIEAQTGRSTPRPGGKGKSAFG